MYIHRDGSGRRVGEQIGSPKRSGPGAGHLQSCQILFTLILKLQKKFNSMLK